jgi:putative heme-binding domain-containing protein
MHPRLCLILAVCFTVMRVDAEPPEPAWIWSGEGDRLSSSDMTATRRFSADGDIERATLRATADFAALTVILNGKKVISLDPYDPPTETDISRFLTDGENTLVATASGVDGPSAIAIAVELDRKGGEPLMISTDARWEVAGGDAIRELGMVDQRRWALNRLPDVSPFAEYNQWREALQGDGQNAPTPGGSKLSPLPQGFEIVKIRDAAASEDSWISLAIDPKGRLIISKEQKGLLRLTLSDNGNEVVESVTIDDTLEECRGLVWHGDALYVHANRGKALYRLRDTDGDDRPDETRLLQTTEGGSGHGRNDLAVGPDGGIHAIVGDDIAVPELSPRRARPEPGAPKELGHWARWTESNGSGTWEAMNRGLRNPYGIDFNADGEAFTYDADNEGDVGLPFYRPTRINHLVSGANYGWHQDRGNTRSIPIHAPESVPTNCDLGRGSPTGVKFGTRSQFPPPWKDALYALDWAYGRIVAVHLSPNGAGYLGSGEVFLEGRPLNVTDLDFDADGAMWFVTGGRKTQSALYRIRYTGTSSPSATPGEQANSVAAFSTEARKLRRDLEQYHGQPDPRAVTVAWPHLGSPDPWIRHAARVAIEWQPVGTWRDRALASQADLGGLTAILALVRAGTDEDRAAAGVTVSTFSLDDSASRIEKLTLLRIHDLAGVPNSPDTRSKVEKQMLSLLPDLSEPVNREVARGLSAIGSSRAVAFGLERLASADDQLERLHFLEVLSETGPGWTGEQRTLFFNSLAHARRFSYGDRFLAPFFQTLEKTALSSVAEPQELTRLAALLVEEAEPLKETAPARPFVKHWTMDDFPLSGANTEAANLTRGRDLYSAVLCAQCHVCGTTGRPVGPDLTTVANRFNRHDLIESIIEPSKVVAEVHRNVIVTKTDGSVLQGRIVQNDFRESKLSLSTNPFAPSELLILPKSEIRSWEESPISPMPPALIDTLTRAEIEDLLAFILSGGAAE